VAEDSHAGIDGRYGCLAKGIGQFRDLEEWDLRSHCITVSSDNMKHSMHHAVLLLNNKFPNVSLTH